MIRTRLYGLTIDSELPLHQLRPPPPGAADLTIRMGAPVPRVDGPPAGRVVLHLQADRQYYTAVETGNGYLLRFYGSCDIELDAGLACARVRLVDGADPAIAAVLAGGTLLAFVLALRGAAVLHASAVQVGDAALGFVGSSGMGKSTMATLMCADGARVITDDLLRLDLDAEPPACALGATELRLRKAAGDLSRAFERAPGRRVTGDARDALAVERSEVEGLPLAALVVPGPDHTGERTRPEIRRLDRMRAFLLLSQFPRLLGWEDAEVLARQFRQLGEITERVPIYVAKLPWGPPFAPGLAVEVRAAVGLSTSVS